MEVMTLLVESMKALQRQISEGHDAQGTIKGVEVVRQLGELPTLGPMHGTTSQLQLGDWLLLMQPVVGNGGIRPQISGGIRPSKKLRNGIKPIKTWHLLIEYDMNQ